MGLALIDWGQRTDNRFPHDVTRLGDKYAIIIVKYLADKSRTAVEPS